MKWTFSSEAQDIDIHVEGDDIWLHSAAAVDIGLFTEVDTFAGQVDELIDELKALPKAEGHDHIFMPGELENRTCDERQQNGIPLPAGTVQRFREVSLRCGIDLPEGF